MTVLATAVAAAVAAAVYVSWYSDWIPQLLQLLQLRCWLSAAVRGGGREANACFYSIYSRGIKLIRTATRASACCLEAFAVRGANVDFHLFCVVFFRDAAPQP